MRTRAPSARSDQ